MSDRRFALTPGKRVLYLTKDPEKIRQQLAGTLTLRMGDVAPEDLLDDINTDAMTPAWVCFDYDPADIAKNAYAGLVIGGTRLIPANALVEAGFEVIVAGAQKGVGSSRETAAQCEVFSGSKLAIASSFAPIHARNNINIGQLMGDHTVLRRLEAGESSRSPSSRRATMRSPRSSSRAAACCRSVRASTRARSASPPRAPACAR